MTNPQAYPGALPRETQARVDLCADLCRWTYRLFLPVSKTQDEARVILAKFPPPGGFNQFHRVTAFKVVSNHSHTFVENSEQPAFIRSMAALVEDEWRSSSGRVKKRIILAFRGTGVNPDGPWLPEYSWGTPDKPGLAPWHWTHIIALFYAYLSVWIVPGLALGDFYQDVRFFRANLVRGAAPNRFLTAEQLQAFTDPNTRWRTITFLIVFSLFVVPLWVPLLLGIVVLVLPIIRLVYYLGPWIKNQNQPSVWFKNGLPFPFEPLEWIYFKIGELFDGGHLPADNTLLGQVHLGFWALWNSPDGYGGYASVDPTPSPSMDNKEVDAKTDGLVTIVGERIKAAKDAGVDVELYITGHSLGGAVSTIAASDIAIRMDSVPFDSLPQFEKCDIYHLTYASPMVGDLKFVQTFEDRFPTDWTSANIAKRWSIAVKRDSDIYSGDPVPKMPPSLVPEPFWYHVGIPVILSGIAWETNVYGLIQRLAPLAFHDIAGYSWLIRDQREYFPGEPCVEQPGVPWNLSASLLEFMKDLIVGLLKFVAVVIYNHLLFLRDLITWRGFELIRAELFWLVDAFMTLGQFGEADEKDA